MNTKTARVAGSLIALIAVVAIAIFLSPSLPPREWAAGVPQWKSSEDIGVVTYTSQHGVQKGDAFSYVVQVWYDRDVVEEIDKASVNKAVSLSPFEVRGVKEREFDADATMRVYERAYEIQLIEGDVSRTYEFPTIVVRYKPKGSAGLLNVGADAQPVFVAARIPEDIEGLELRPIAPTVNDLAQRTLPWVFWVIGAVLAALGATDLFLRVLPQWRSARSSATALWQGNAVAEGYRVLRDNVAEEVEPRRIFHQIDHLVRLTLASRDGLDWLEEPNLEKVPAAIREQVTSLLDTCEEAYRPAQMCHDEVSVALEKLDATLGFYFGAREVEAWRS